MSEFRDEDEHSVYLRELSFEPTQSYPLGAHRSQDAHTIKRKPSPHVSRPEYQTLSDEQHMFLLRHWWVEILTCVLMLGMLFGVFGILYRYQGYPLPEWPFHISINTAISILATVLKAAMLFIVSQGLSQLKWQWFTQSRPLQELGWFDAASRGPWGCLQLLVGLKVLHPVASWSAILIILSIALDPFFQQLVHYVNCPQVKEGVFATVPRASLYSEAGAQTSPGEWPPATPVLAYVNQGIYNPADIQNPFSCSTGNCTFDDYFRTLGFCATCEDLTDDLRIFSVDIPDPTNASDISTWINTTLPSGTYASFQGQGAPQSWFTVNYTNDQWFEMVLAASSVPGTKYHQEDAHYISSVLRDQPAYVSACRTAYENATWACGTNGVGAARCRLDPCVKTYRANISYNQLQEEVVATNLNMFVGSAETWTMADLGCAGEDVFGRLQRSGYDITDPTGLIPWNVVIDDSNLTNTVYTNETYEYFFDGFAFDNVTIPGPLVDGTSLPLDIVPAECIYQMDWPPVASLRDYLISTLVGSIEPGNNLDSIQGPTAIRAILNDSYVSFDSVNFTFQAIAESITIRIREYGAPPFDQYKEPVTGVTWENATCVVVRWPFFIFPAILTGMTALLLVAVILKTEVGEAKKRAQGWKASLWPIVFQELVIERSVMNELSNTKTGSREMMYDEMKQYATRTHARLRVASEQKDS